MGKRKDCEGDDQCAGHHVRRLIHLNVDMPVPSADIVMCLYREHLKSVPDQLETLMSEKKLLLASLVLVRALKTINKPEMLEIGALSDLRSYLSSQEIVGLASLRFVKFVYISSSLRTSITPRYCKRSWSKSCITISISSPTTATVDGRRTSEANKNVRYVHLASHNLRS